MEKDIAVKENAVQAMKIAVALAVLRNKPPGLSGSAYAEDLCERFRASQLHWKQQCERAETEILHLKQQLTLNTQTLQPVDRVKVAQSQIFEDSLPSSSQSLFPTPPPSGSAGASQGVASATPTFDAQLSLAKHTEFLHHVINIQTASKISTSDRSLQDITHESLLHSLQLLQTHIGDEQISWTIQEQCVQIIVAVLNKHISDCVLDKVSSICTRLIGDIMSHSKQNYKVLEKKSYLLCLFSECKQFTPTLLSLLSAAIKTYSDSLRKCVNDKEFLDADKFCNSYFIIKATENCLCKCIRELKNDMKLEIRTKLEDSLLHISEQFPLFAHAVWRLCALLS